MPLTKSTIRALAASIALVAAGATVAAAAVFQLPILGFAQAHASAAVSPGGTHVVTRPAAPVKIVRTRYVYDIVHRPASATAYPAVRVVAATTPPPATLVAAVARPATSPTSVGAQPRQSPRPSFRDGSELEHGGSDHALPGTRSAASTKVNRSGSDG